MKFTDETKTIILNFPDDIKWNDFVNIFKQANFDLAISFNKKGTYESSKNSKKT